jgi:hypothetical protein
MVPAAQLAALGRTGEAATLLPRSHFRRATNLSRERLSVPEARDVPGHSEHARFRASARLDPGVLASGSPCPRSAHIVLSCLLCLCASSKPLKSGASLSSLTQGAPSESLVHARGFNANYRPISGRGRVPGKPEAVSSFTNPRELLAAISVLTLKHTRQCRMGKQHNKRKKPVCM